MNTLEINDSTLRLEADLKALFPDGLPTGTRAELHPCAYSEREPGKPLGGILIQLYGQEVSSDSSHEG
jgi:hypothetical protein